MSKEDKLAKQAAKIEAKQNKLAAKKAAKEQKRKKPEPNYSFVETPETEAAGSSYMDDPAKITKQPKPKKPLLKRWWFWLIIVFAVLIIIVAIGNALGPSISKDFKLGKTATIADMNYKIPSGWTAADKNTAKHAKYTLKDSGDFVGSMDIYYISNGDRIAKSDVKEYLVPKKADDPEYGTMKLSGADKCRTVEYTYDKGDNTYAVRGYLIMCKGAIFGVKVTAVESVDTDTADKIAGGLDLKGFVNNVKVKDVYAVYLGKTKAGTKVTQDSKISVVAEYTDGTGSSVYGYKLKNPATLKADKSYNFKIAYKGKTATMPVSCSTISASHYKALCKTYSYNQLSHKSTSSLYGARIKVRGEVTQVIDTGVYMIDVSTGYDFGNYVIVSIENPTTKVVENDTITAYGLVAGDYTYETVLGAEKTVPQVLAKYIN